MIVPFFNTFVPRSNFYAASQGDDLMCLKTIETNENMMETLHYPEKELPVLRLEQHLDEFKNGEINRHWHAEFLFGLLLNGELDYSIFENPVSNTHRILKPGDGIFINSRVLHGCRQTVPGSVLFTFGLTPSYFASPVFGNLYQKVILPILRSEKYGLFLFAGHEEDDAILKRLTILHNLFHDDTNYELRSVELICQLWQILSQRFEIPKNLPLCAGTNPVYASRVRVMLEYIHQHYREPLTIEQIAQAGGVSRRACFRCFRDVINQTPNEYLTQYRLSMAAYLLTHTDKPLSAVSEVCGFENTSYFAKCFKQRYGIPPRQFRH